MPRAPRIGCTITYELLQPLTDLPRNTIYQAAARSAVSVKRMGLDITNIESVILWVAAHGRIDLRRRIAALAAPAWNDSPRSAPVKKRRRKKA